MRELDSLATERLESLKAASLGAISTTIALLIFRAIAGQLPDLHHWQGWVPVATVAGSGFLFGVAYRYLIRTDDNVQLKAGGVLAFAVVRGLAQIEIASTAIGSWSDAWWVLANLGSESLWLFAVAGLGLNWAIARGWLRAMR